MGMVPAQRPRMSEAELMAKVVPMGITPADLMFVAGVRGYYRDTMGVAGRNDRGIYDDALFLVAPGIFFAAYNGNTDPSRIRKGSGDGASKGMARLKSPQLCRVHRFDLHRGKYLALCQRGGNVTVIRDGIVQDYERTGGFGINIHKGGFNTTSSEGCQTFHPNQWPGFIASAVELAKRLYGTRWNRVDIPYALFDA